MKEFVIKGNRTIPTINFDVKNDVFLIEGRSCPEDVATFYKPLIDWIEEYQENPNEVTVFDFNLIYFNTATAKILLNIMQKIEQLYNSGAEVTIKWNYPDDDEDLEETGQDYQDMIDVPFELIPYEFED
ncbi:MAG: DUF1987 domain-containing protein [Bacteroidales bacterium]|nr:DUF1987 domain-containing protein [Bacteroidales bacterium]